MFSSRWVLMLAGILGLVTALPHLLYLYLPAQWPLDVARHAVGRDFVNLWVGGRLLAEGHWQTLFDVFAYRAALHEIFSPHLAPHVWSYPPTSFLLAEPLAALPYGTALAVWTLAGLALFAAAARIGFDIRLTQRALGIALVAPALVLNVICGQNGFLTAALMAGGILMLDRRPVIAGVLIGLLSFKPHLGIVLAPALLALGAWTAIASAAATAVGMALLSVALYGIEPWRAFVATTVPLQGRFLSHFEGFFVNMLVSPYASFRAFGLSHGPAMAVQSLLALIVVVACAMAVRRTRDADIRLHLVATATFLATPYALTYDLPVIALVIARRFARDPAAQWTMPQAFLFGSAWAAPLCSAPLTAVGLPVVPLVMGALFYHACRPLLEPERLLARLQDRTGFRAQTSSRL